MTKGQRKMTDYKLVPVEPTPKMLQVWKQMYGYSRYDKYKAMLDEAPDVQGEPVAFCEDAALLIAERTFSTEVDEQLASDIIQYAQRLHSLYAAPQPTEQQREPCHECGGNGAGGEHEEDCSQQPAPDMLGLTEALRQYQHNDGSGLVFGYDKLLVDQYVAGLVEALEEARLTIEVLQGRGKSAGVTLSIVDRALAPYLKGGE